MLIVTREDGTVVPLQLGIQKVGKSGFLNLLLLLSTLDAERFTFFNLFLPALPDEVKLNLSARVELVLVLSQDAVKQL